MLCLIITVKVGGSGTVGQQQAATNFFQLWVSLAIFCLRLPLLFGSISSFFPTAVWDPFLPPGITGVYRNSALMRDAVDTFSK